MHSVKANSAACVVAGLRAKFRHNRKRIGKAAPRRVRKQERDIEREYVNTVKRCLWPCWHDFVEL